MLLLEVVVLVVLRLPVVALVVAVLRSLLVLVLIVVLLLIIILLRRSLVLIVVVVSLIIIVITLVAALVHVRLLIIRLLIVLLLHRSLMLGGIIRLSIMVRSKSGCTSWCETLSRYKALHRGLRHRWRCGHTVVRHEVSLLLLLLTIVPVVAIVSRMIVLCLRLKVILRRNSLVRLKIRNLWSHRCRSLSLVSRNKSLWTTCRNEGCALSRCEHKCTRVETIKIHES